MSVFSNDLRLLIEAAGHGTYGTDLFVSSMADIPSTGRVIVIRDTGGSGPDHTHDGPPSGAYRFPGAQIMVKSESFDDAMALAHVLFVDVTSVVNRDVFGTWYRRIRSLNEPFDMGQLDDSERAQVVFNVLGDKRP